MVKHVFLIFREPPSERATPKVAGMPFCATQDLFVSLPRPEGC